MEIREFVKKIADISPRIQDIKLTPELWDVSGFVEGTSWTQIEPSGKWKVEFIVDKEKELKMQTGFNYTQQIPD